MVHPQKEGQNGFSIAYFDRLALRISLDDRAQESDCGGVTSKQQIVDESDLQLALELEDTR
jgi:hypothetical protein